MGAGSWGTTLAVLLASKGESVTLWARDRDLVAQMRKERRNPRYVSDVPFPPTLTPVDDLAEALAGERHVVHAVPSKATRELARAYAKRLDPGARLVSATKGLELRTHKRMSEVLHQETGRPVAALSGPNHAEEVSAGQPTAAVLAYPDMDLAKEWAALFETRTFKAYPRRDLVGVEVCGAYKNVVALAGGMAEGLGWGDNCAACLITLGIDEMMDLARLFGADERTVTGLAGVGDLVATAMSEHSRNRFYGRELGKGVPPDAIKAKMHGQVAEGVHATQAFHEYAVEERLDLPLTRVVHRIVYEGISVKQGVAELLARV
ncbi:MAG TPA: NAD(P)H-dependent glycerol-3-phosphate dehydrogenase [Candidatus Thermoplasmatota archaeon]|nr:NAD(P)H-dependent glycerol-3-phosphate dehydrogenase [Candidatus Thermoplasmatota archaeon]